MNVDKVDPSVEIELGGKTYKLVFDFEAFIRIEAKTGKNMLSGEMFQNINATNLVTLLWAALRPLDALSLQDVARTLNPFHTGKYIEKISEAMAKAVPSDEALEKKDAAGVAEEKSIEAPAAPAAK